MTIAELLIRIGADTSGFTRSIDGAESRLQGMGKRMTAIGGTLTKGVTAPLVGVGTAAVMMAANAAESASKMEAVFGSASDEMNDWITDLQRTVPATRAQLQGMTSEIQDLLVPLGMAPKAAQDMTQAATKLAADLASFNNIGADEALGKIRAAMVGSYQPALSFGVALSAATVEAKALEMGLIAEGEALSANARAQAAFQLVLEGTTAAHDDAANTAESAANSFKFLMRDVKELAVTIGDILLPVITPMIQSLTRVIGRLDTLSPATQKTIVVVGGLAAAIGPLLLGVGAVISILPLLTAGFVALTGPVGLTVAAVSALATAWMIWGDDVKRITASAVESVTEWFGKLAAPFERVKEGITSITGAFRNMYDKVVGNSYVPDMVDGIEREFARLQAVMVDPALKAAAQVNSAFAGTAAGVLASLNPMTMLTSMAVGMASSAMRGLMTKGIDSLLGRSKGAAAPTVPQAPSFASSGSNVPGSFDLGAARRHAGGASGVTVHIHNPPAGMDVVAVARQVKRAIAEDRRRGGISEFDVALTPAY